MVSRGAKVGILLALAAGVATVFMLSRPVSGAPPPTGVTALSISAAPLSGTAPLTVTFTGQATNASGAPVANVTIYLFVNGVSQGTTQTNATGNFSIMFSFTAAGTYVCFASDNVQGI